MPSTRFFPLSMLGEYDLNWWTQRLAPICAAFVQTALGKPPLDFWQSIYKPEGTYGEKVMTGWVADLFPYILAPHATPLSSPTERNPLLAIPQKKVRVEDGILPSSLPRGLARVPFTLEWEGRENAGGLSGAETQRRYQ